MGEESEGAAALANKRAILVAVDDSEVGSISSPGLSLVTHTVWR